MSCDVCAGHSLYRPCPCCDETVYKEVPVVNTDLLDVVFRDRPSAYGFKVEFTARPLDFFLWAHDLGYSVEIKDGGEVWLLSNGRVEYTAWHQHEDFMDDRSEAFHLNNWREGR